MTKVMEIIKENKISVYSLLKKMGLDPVQVQGNWTKKLQGETYLSVSEVLDLSDALEKITGEYPGKIADVEKMKLI